MSSLSTFTFIEGSHHNHLDGDDDDGLIYEETHVKESRVVPFCWEMKPGVPLLLSSKFGAEFTKGKARGDDQVGSLGGSLTMLNESQGVSKTADEDLDDKAFTTKHAVLFPLPPPPSSLHISANNKVNVFAREKYYGSKVSSATLPLSSPNPNPKITHTNKPIKLRSFPLFVNKGTAWCYAGKDQKMKDDPFMRAIQACTQSKNIGTARGKPYGDDDRKLSALNQESCTSPQAMVDSTVNPGAVRISRTRKETSDDVVDIRSARDNRNYNYQLAMVAPADRAAAKLHGTTKLNRTNKETWEDVDVRSAGDNGAPKSSPLRLLLTSEEDSAGENKGRNMNARLYERHSAFMAGSFRQAAKQKRPPISKSVRQRSPAGGYGCMGCGTAHSCDIIVHTYNYNSRP